MRNAHDLRPDAGAFPAPQVITYVAVPGNLAGGASGASSRSRTDRAGNRRPAGDGSAARVAERLAAARLPDNAPTVGAEAVLSRAGFRHASFAEIIATIAAAAAERVRRAFAQRVGDLDAWRGRREVRLEAALLRDLDPRILRDIGIAESGAVSTASERHGLVEATRVRVLLDAYQGGR